jgi:hypothetical protein
LGSGFTTYLNEKVGLRPDPPLHTYRKIHTVLAAVGAAVGAADGPGGGSGDGEVVRQASGGRADGLSGLDAGPTDDRGVGKSQRVGAGNDESVEVDPELRVSGDQCHNFDKRSFATKYQMYLICRKKLLVTNVFEKNVFGTKKLI